jgi:hypothetical protein
MQPYTDISIHIENEPDENEPDEDEGGHNGNNMKAMSHMAKNNMAAMVSSSSTPAMGAAAMMPSTTANMMMTTSMSSMTPTGSMSSSIPSGWSSVASDASVWQSSVMGAASSWVGGGKLKRNIM